MNASLEDTIKAAKAEIAQHQRHCLDFLKIQQIGTITSANFFSGQLDLSIGCSAIDGGLVHYCLLSENIH